ncbi:MAG TPA: hypothetical protein VIW64_17005 [Pyrinomonadaceae bacterium]|jgi:hypothetical protein
MLEVQIETESIRIDNHFVICFKRTLRIPEDGQLHKTPPNFGVFPIYRVEEFAERLPESWQRQPGVFIPMYQREGLYIRFDNEKPWQPYAVKVSVGGINAISGEPHSNALRAEPQDYLVCPPQLWLDGIYTSRGTTRQFLAVPLGGGETVEAAISGSENVGGVQITIFAPKAGAFPENAPDIKPTLRPTALGQRPSAATAQMGLAAGAGIKQKVLPDPHGIETWDQNNFAEINLHILNSAQFKSVTGLDAPATTINEETYAENGFPWFPLYGETQQGDVSPSELLAGVKTIGEQNREQ